MNIGGHKYFQIMHIASFSFVVLEIVPNPKKVCELGVGLKAFKIQREGLQRWGGSGKMDRAKAQPWDLGMHIFWKPTIESLYDTLSINKIVDKFVFKTLKMIMLCSLLTTF